MKRKRTVVEGVLGRLKPILHAGSRLPSERELSRSLRVSRPSLREALRTLELMGVVDTKHGSGTQVAGSGSDILRAPLEFLFLLDRPTIPDLHETRTLLEVHLAGRAAERRTDAQLEEMADALREMKARLQKPSEVTAHDVRFHQAVAAASGNRFLERLMNSLRDEIAGLIDVAWPGTPSMARSYRAHARILGAIRRGDPAAARRAMLRHMELAAEELRHVKALR